VIRAARELEGVAAVDTFRAVELTFQGRLTNVVAIDLELQRRFGRLAFLGGGREDRIGRALAEGGVLITESFGHRFRVREGDLLPLPTPTGLHRLRVAGVFYDYSTDGGYLMLDVRRFRELWSQDRTESLAMYLRPGQSVDDARSRFIRAVGPRTLLYVTPNQALRARVLRIFDQTFQITYALQAIAILVAVMGVVSTLTALILQRSREIGILRAVGALRRQVQRMVWMESALLGLIGSLLGCACGLALALLLVYVINKQFFGWSIRLVLDPWLLVQTTAMIVGAALVAGTWPARIAASRLAAEAMRGE
jgi:putative ABC transport system permease protein